MRIEAILAELRERLSLAQGSPSLLLVLCPSDGVVAETRRLLLEILQATPMSIVDLGLCETDAGPARWAEQTKATPGDAFLLTLPAAAPLTWKAFARLLNAERQLLRGLTGPVVLLTTRAAEQMLRQHAQDFSTWIAATYELPEPAEIRGAATMLGVAPERLAPQSPPEPPIRFLHISDLHLRPATTRRYDQDRVLEGLLALLARDRPEFPLDLIFVTGDLAHGGKPDEYTQVVELLERLVDVTGVPPERIFVVPGNHDVDRGVGRWLRRTLTDDTESVDFFLEPRNREFHLKKLEAYSSSLGKLLGPARPLGLKTGAEAVEILEIKGARLAIASFNSAWFAQGDDDRGKLWLGEPNIRGALDRVADEEAVFAIALLHHPFEDLHPDDRARAEPLFERGFDLMLRGHLHSDKTQSLITQRGGYVEQAAPAAYQGSQWPNGCYLGEIRAHARTIRLRPYTFASGADPWVLNTKIFPDDDKDGYTHTFTVPAKQRRRSQALRAAAKQAIKSLPEATRQELVQQVAGNIDSAASELSRESVTADLLAESPAVWRSVLGHDSAIVAWGAAISQMENLARQPEKISLNNPEDFKKALLQAGRLYLQAAPKRLFHRHQLADRMFTFAITVALQQVVDGLVVQSADIFVPSGIAIYPRNGGAPLGILETKTLQRTSMVSNSFLARNLIQVKHYVLKAGAKFGALVLFNSLPPESEEPRVDSVELSDGHGIVVMHL